MDDLPGFPKWLEKLIRADRCRNTSDGVVVGKNGSFTDKLWDKSTTNKSKRQKTNQ